MLPTTKTEPIDDLQSLLVCVYGPSKIGKSTLCAEIPNALFLATEPGLNHLSCFQVEIHTWEEYGQAVKELLAGGHDFECVVIDTVDNLYEMCSAYVCKQAGVKHESDLPMGKGWSLVRAQFKRGIGALANSPLGLWMVSHAKEETVKTQVGEYQRTTLTLPGQAKKEVIGLVDLILFADTEERRDEDGKPQQIRVLRTKPTQYYEAGDRTGRLPATLPLNYAALAAAFTRGTR